MHVIVRLISSDQDEPENPEDLPEYKQKMRGDRVMGINYSFLWQHLEPSQLLPKLVDKELMTETGKKEAESYKQKFAQNAVIINELFGAHCSPLKLCDTGCHWTGTRCKEATARYTLCRVRYIHCFFLLRNRIVFCTGTRGQQSMQFKCFLTITTPCLKVFTCTSLQISATHI